RITTSVELSANDELGELLQWGPPIGLRNGCMLRHGLTLLGRPSPGLLGLPRLSRTRRPPRGESARKKPGGSKHRKPSGAAPAKRECKGLHLRHGDGLGVPTALPGS